MKKTFNLCVCTLYKTAQPLAPAIWQIVTVLHLSRLTACGSEDELAPASCKIVICNNSSQWKAEVSDKSTACGSKDDFVS